MNTEKRKKTRVHFEAQVILKSGTIEIVSNVISKDISLKGMFIKTDKKIPLEALCDIKILLTGTTNKISINLKGRIVRQDSSGLGLSFDSMDLESYSHLRNLLMYNAVDPDAMEKEMRQEF